MSEPGYEEVEEPSSSRLARSGRWLLELTWALGRLFTITLIAALADQIPPLVALHDYLEEHPQPWLALTLGSAGIGWVLLWTCWLSMIFGGDRLRRRPRRRPTPVRRRGEPRRRLVFPRRIPGASSLGEVKEAFRTGDWITDPAIRPMCLGFLGVLFTVFGMFGVFVVIGPPSAQIVCTAAIGFVFWQMARGFLRA